MNDANEITNVFHDEMTSRTFLYHIKLIREISAEILETSSTKRLDDLRAAVHMIGVMIERNEISKADAMLLSKEILSKADLEVPGDSDVRIEHCLIGVAKSLWLASGGKHEDFPSYKRILLIPNC